MRMLAAPQAEEGHLSSALRCCASSWALARSSLSRAFSLRVSFARGRPSAGSPPAPLSGMPATSGNGPATEDGPVCSASAFCFFPCNQAMDGHQMGTV